MLSVAAGDVCQPDNAAEDGQGGVQNGDGDYEQGSDQPDKIVGLGRKENSNA